MLLLIIRHAVAEEREDFERTGQDDALRPLTKTGRWKMERVTKGLRRAVPSIDLLATSPLVRATETAEIVAEAYDGVPTQVVDALAPESRHTAFLQWLRAQHAEGAVAEGTVAAVGHEPHLGQLATWLLAGQAGEWLPLKKGGACLLEFGGRPRAGGATLHWALTPSQLRRLD